MDADEFELERIKRYGKDYKPAPGSIYYREDGDYSEDIEFFEKLKRDYDERKRRDAEEKRKQG